jgi:MscS family membrane protein
MLKAFFTLIITAVLCFLLSIFYQKYQQRLDRKLTILRMALLESIYRPLLVLIAILGILYALESLCLPWKGITPNQFHLMQDLSFTGLLAWFLWRFVSFSKAAYLLTYKNKTRKKTIDRTVVHGLSQIAKLAIIILTVLSLFQIFGFSIAGVLAFGGMGGIAIGFAAKDLLANLFGGLMLFLDRPFVIGDQISLPALKVEGTVEEIGWRVCRIRTPDCRPVYIPNALFSNLVVENPSRMKYRRFYCRISLRYQDLMKVPAILEDMQSLLKKNTAIDKNRPIIVNLNELGNTSLNLVVAAYTHIINSADFLKVQQVLLLDLLACIRHHGAEWSFPSHNVFLNKEGTELVGSQK